MRDLFFVVLLFFPVAFFAHEVDGEEETTQATTLPEEQSAEPSKSKGEINTQSPLAFLKSHDAKVQDLLSGAPSGPLASALKEQVKTNINAGFDFEELSRQALGTHWQDRTPEERNDFVETFSSIIAEKNFDNFVRYYREGQINYQNEKITDTKAAITATVPFNEEAVQLVYHLHLKAGLWRVWDVVIDGASTVAGYQRQYGRYIEKHSYQKLVDQLHKQLDKLRQEKS